LLIEDDFHMSIVLM